MQRAFDATAEHGIFAFLNARDLCVVVHQVQRTWARNTSWNRYYWKRRPDTACSHGVQFNRWFGGHTGMCCCSSSGGGEWCRHWLWSVKHDSLWQLPYHGLGPVVWAQAYPHGPGGTVVVYKKGYLGVLGTGGKWWYNPVQTHNINRACGGIVKQCASFGNNFLALLGNNGVVVVTLRRGAWPPYFCGMLTFPSAISSFVALKTHFVFRLACGALRINKFCETDVVTLDASSGCTVFLGRQKLVVRLAALFPQAVYHHVLSKERQRARCN